MPEERLRVVETLIAECRPSREIVRRVAAQFGCTERQVWNYLRRVYQRLESEDKSAKPMRKHSMRASLQAFFQEAMKDKHYGPALAALDRLCKLDGLYAPESVKVEHQGAVEMNIDAMTTDERRQEIERLLKVRDEMMSPHHSRAQDKDEIGPN